MLKACGFFLFLALGFAVRTSLAYSKNHRVCFHSPEKQGLFDRRTAIASLASLAGFSQQRVWADVEVPAVEQIESRTFVDPKGFFLITIPKSYYAIRRSAKGDLPDEKTGKGRRGSSIFTAGNMAKAEVIAVERFPTRTLLEENGIEASGNLSTFPNLGEPAAIAQLLALRRDRDKPGAGSTRVLTETVSVSEDGKELQFALFTKIDVQNPELLLEQTGVSELNRLTLAKASLRSNDGNLLAVFASALEADFKGPDGKALEKAVATFRVNDQSTLAP